MIDLSQHKNQSRIDGTLGINGEIRYSMASKISVFGALENTINNSNYDGVDTTNDYNYNALAMNIGLELSF